MAEYTIHMTCEGDGSETATVDAADLADLREQADEATRDWIKDGEWGNDGASVSGRWEALDDDGDTLTDDDGDEVAGTVSVEIEPDHAALIRKACGGRHSDEWGRCCGDDPDDHDWTSAGEGGCDSNPGVWSVGGTAMVFAAHCRACGLHRQSRSTGSQRNPGEHDTVSYEMPEAWCAECGREECSCEADDEE